MPKLRKNIVSVLLFSVGLTLFFLPHKIYAQKSDKFTVVIDPGHGGKDSGTKGTGKTKIYEKDVVLSVGKKVAENLRKHKDINVIMTRDSDKFLELHQRARIANKNKADVFVSIHCNASKNPKAKGSETYVLGIHRNKDNLEVAKRENAVILLEDDYQLHYEGFDPNAPETFIGLELLQEEFLEQSILLASMMQREFEKRIPTKNRSVQQAGFAVLRLTYMPSVLTEIGFLSNPAEEKFLHSESGQNKVAQAISKAILDYKKIFEENTVRPTEINNSTSSTGTTASEINKPEPKPETHTAENKAFFSVQIKSSTKDIPATPENFHGLSPLFKKKIDGIYKYFYGKTPNLDEAKRLLRIARKSGYHDAFVVGFINGKRVSVKELLSHQKNN